MILYFNDMCQNHPSVIYRSQNVRTITAEGQGRGGGLVAGGGRRVPRGVDQHRPGLGLAALTALHHGAAFLRSFSSIRY